MLGRGSLGGDRHLVAVAVADRDSRRVHHAHRSPSDHRRDGRRRAGPDARGCGVRGRGAEGAPAALRPAVVAGLHLSNRQGLSGVGDPGRQRRRASGDGDGRTGPRSYAAHPPLGLLLQRLRDRRACTVSRPSVSDPADELHSHTVNDQIPLAQLEPAMAFYAMFPQVYRSRAKATDRTSSRSRLRLQQRKPRGTEYTEKRRDHLLNPSQLEV